MLSQQVLTGMSGGSMIRKMFEEGTRLKALYGEENVYDFSIGNPDLDPPEAFRASLRAALDYPDVHKYMANAGYPDVREAIAQREGARAGLAMGATHVVMTVGAAGALNVALKSILNPGDEVIVLAPYFVEYLFYIKNNHGVTPIIVNTDAETFQPDVEAIAQAITPHTKAIILNTPHNPTGVVYGADLLQAMADVLETAEKRTGNPIYVLSDEPYAALCYESTPPPILRYFKNGMVLNSFSKSLCLPGERIGYIAVNPQAQDVEQLIPALVFSLRTLGFVNAPSLMQRALLGALDVAVDVEIYRKRRDRLYQIITDAGFSCTLPQGAFYLFPKAPGGDALNFTEEAAKLCILSAPGDGFGWPGHFRLAYCVEEGVIERSQEAWHKLAQRFM